MKNCKLYPDKGTDFFKKLVSRVGRNAAVDIYYYCCNRNLKSNKSLSFDAEGFPTNIDKLFEIEGIQELVGDKVISKVLNIDYEELPNNYTNYDNAIKQAYTFNTNSIYNKKYTAIVKIQEGKVKVHIELKNDKNEQLAKEQYASMKLNENIMIALKPLGITQDTLLSEEIDENGIIQWDKTKNIGFDITDLIKVANNEGGYRALSEEFSHLLVSLLKENTFVQRSLNLLKSKEDLIKSILGSEYESYKEKYKNNIDTLAEEALGKILQIHLLSNQGELKDSPLFERLINNIKSRFSKFEKEELENSLQELNNIVSGEIVGKLLNDLTFVNRENIYNSEGKTLYSITPEESRFFQTDNKEDLEIVRNIINIENRARVFTKNLNESFDNNFLDKYKEFKKYYENPEFKNKAILIYLEGCISSLNTALEKLETINKGIKKSKVNDMDIYFTFFKEIKFLIDSKKPIIQACLDIINKNNIAYLNENGEDITEDILKIITSLNSKYQYLENTYHNTTIPLFSSFLKDFFGVDSFKVSETENKKIEDIVRRADKDVSLTSEWLDAMIDSSDVLLQKIAEIVKIQKEKARQESITDIQKIQQWRIKAEKAGITNFDWMYEKDENGHPIGYTASYKYGEYVKAKKEFWEQENAKYGKILNDKEKEERKKNWETWKAENTIDGKTPNDKYENTEYKNLSETQKELLEEFLNLKESYDKRLHRKGLHRFRCIQIRKSGVQRIYDSSSPSEVFSNVKNAVSEQFLKKVDDDSLYGDLNAQYTSIDLGGNPIRKLPALFVNKIENSTELSTDPVATLMQYSYSTNTYKNMSEIVDPLEVARDIFKNKRETPIQKDGKNIKLSTKVGTEIFEDLLRSTGNSGAYEMLSSFLDIHVYQRTLQKIESSGKVDITKSINSVLNISTFLQMSFNIFSDAANLIQNTLNTNNLAFAKKFFSPQDLFYADKEYASLLPAFFSELNSRSKTNKLSLFTEYFDIQGDYNREIKQEQSSSVVRRLLGKNISFVTSEAATHCTSTRVAIAYCKAKKVKKNGVEMSLWEALTVEELSEGVGRLNIENITDLEGNSLDLKKEKIKIQSILRRYLGLQTADDMNKAKQYVWGRLILNYKGWWKPLLNTRFQSKQYDSLLDITEEGFYRTIWNLGKDIVQGKREIAGIWESLEDYEKQNVKSALTEFVTFIVLFVLSNINWSEYEDDDDDKKWEEGFNMWKAANYMTNRLVHEVGIFTPFAPTLFLNENKKLWENPIPALSICDGIFKFIGNTFAFWEYGDEIKQGKYKGFTKFEKGLIELPTPVGAWYRQYLKAMSLEDTVKFYTK